MNYCYWAKMGQPFFYPVLMFSMPRMNSFGASVAAAISVLTAGELLVQARDVYSNMFGEPGDPEEVGL